MFKILSYLAVTAIALLNSRANAEVGKLPHGQGLFPDGSINACVYRLSFPVAGEVEVSLQKTAIDTKVELDFQEFNDFAEVRDGQSQRFTLTKSPQVLTFDVILAKDTKIWCSHVVPTLESKDDCSSSPTTGSGATNAWERISTWKFGDDGILTIKYTVSAPAEPCPPPES